MLLYKVVNAFLGSITNNTTMEPKKLAELTDQELLQVAKKQQSTTILNAVLIGFLIGIVFYSVMQNSLGFFTLIPLYFAYRLVNQSKYDRKELSDLLKVRNLKS